MAYSCSTPGASFWNSHPKNNRLSRLTAQGASNANFNHPEAGNKCLFNLTMCNDDGPLFSVLLSSSCLELSPVLSQYTRLLLLTFFVIVIRFLLLFSLDLLFTDC